MLSADELAKANEVCQWTTALYEQHGWNVLYTVQMPSGDLYDYIDRSGVPDSQEQPPPPLSDMTLPPGVGMLLSELDMHPELRGPARTQLRVRPDFSLYISGNTGAPTLSDFIKTYVVAGTPTGGGRLYAGISSTNNPKDNPTPNVGAAAWVMPYAGPIEPGTMSLLEMAVGCRNTAKPGFPMEQMIGVAASRDYANTRFAHFGDSVLRLQVEFYTNGFDWVGPGKGGWAGTVSIGDFEPYPDKNNPLAPGMALYPSTVGGTQYASHFWIILSNQRWWVVFNGIPIGSYDAAKTGGLDTNACEALCYGETYNPGYDPNVTPPKAAPKWPPMGSGHFAEDGWGYASFFLNPIYFDMSLTPVAPVNGGMVNKNLYNPNCYTTSGLINFLPPYNYIVYIGGPGGDAPNNACPAPAPPPPQP